MHPSQASEARWKAGLFTFAWYLWPVKWWDMGADLSARVGKLTGESAVEVDAVLAAVGLTHGRRVSRKGTWQRGERVGEGTGAVRRSAKVSKAMPQNRNMGHPALRDAGHPAWDGVVRVQGWEKMGWLRCGFSTRLGGASTVYSGGEAGELNLGWTASDEAKLMAKNRRLLMKGVGAAGMEMAALRQVHSGVVRVLGAEHGALATNDGKAVLRGDGVMTDVPGMLLAVQVADCVPVIVVDRKKKAVAAFHAGWRGTVARIVERGVGRMRMEYGSRPEDLMAAVGPAIGACCYAVGEEVRGEFVSQFAYADELFSEVYDSDPVREKYPLLFLTARAPGHSPIGPQLHVDLWEANRRQLLDAGLKAKNITVVGECTACAVAKSGGAEGGGRKYFSHRGEHGFTGRMMGVVGIGA